MRNKIVGMRIYWTNILRHMLGSLQKVLVVKLLKIIELYRQIEFPKISLGFSPDLTGGKCIISQLFFSYKFSI